MPSVIANQNQVSQPLMVPGGGLVTITPQAGASALVEYTKDGAAAVLNGTARWVSWPKGPVSSATIDIANDPLYVRVTASSGAVTLTVDETTNSATLDAFRRDWMSAEMGPIILAQAAIPASVTGTTSDTTLATATVPGGLIGPNGSLRVTSLWSMTNNVNNKFPRVRLAGGTFLTSPQLGAVGSFHAVAILRNRSVPNSQVLFNAGSSGGGLGTNGNAASTASLDLTVDQVLTFSGQLAVGTDTLTLEGYTVEVLPG